MMSLEKKLGSAQRRAVLNEIKRSSGLAVGELAQRIELSYMGAKQHCLALEKNGLLTSRNEHRGAGRPFLIYRVSAKGQALFAAEDGQLVISLLNQARALFGVGAPGKLLYSHFQEKTAGYLEKMPTQAMPQARLEALAKLRDADGHMCHAEENVIIEYHAPWRSLFTAFPEASALEEAMLTKVAGFPLKRRVLENDAHIEIRFEAFRCPDPKG